MAVFFAQVWQEIDNLVPITGEGHTYARCKPASPFNLEATNLETFLEWP